MIEMMRRNGQWRTYVCAGGWHGGIVYCVFCRGSVCTSLLRGLVVDEFVEGIGDL